MAGSSVAPGGSGGRGGERGRGIGQLPCVLGRPVLQGCCGRATRARYVRVSPRSRSRCLFATGKGVRGRSPQRWSARTLAETRPSQTRSGGTSCCRSRRELARVWALGAAAYPHAPSGSRWETPSVSTGEPDGRGERGRTADDDELAPDLGAGAAERVSRCCRKTSDDADGRLGRALERRERGGRDRRGG